MRDRVLTFLSIICLAGAFSCAGCGSAATAGFDPGDDQPGDSGPGGSGSDSGPGDGGVGPGDTGTGGSPDGGGSCLTNADCPPDHTCNAGTCVPPGGGGPDGGTGGTGGGSDGGTGGTGGGDDGGSDGGTGGTGGGPSGGSDGGTGGGGTGGDGGTGGGGSCLTNADCPANMVCEEGVCVTDGDGDDGHDLTCRPGKTLLCHYPPGNPDNLHEICVGNPAVPAHLALGDTLGTCP